MLQERVAGHTGQTVVAKRQLGVAGHVLSTRRPFNQQAGVKGPLVPCGVQGQSPWLFFPFFPFFPYLLPSPTRVSGCA